MRLPRFRFAWLMLAVLIAALDFGVMRATVADYGFNRLFLPCVATLPMVNILAVGLLLIFLRPASRPFLAGFEVFGVSALVLCVSTAWDWTQGRVLLYLVLPIGPLETMFGPPMGQEWYPHQALIVFPLVSLWATWPQLAFAWMGGLLNQKFGFLTWIVEAPVQPNAFDAVRPVRRVQSPVNRSAGRGAQDDVRGRNERPGAGRNPVRWMMRSWTSSCG